MIPMDAITAEEQRLRDVLGPPPPGTNWMDKIRRIVDAMPPLSHEQQDQLSLLLQSHIGGAE